MIVNDYREFFGDDGMDAIMFGLFFWPQRLLQPRIAY